MDHLKVVDREIEVLESIYKNQNAIKQRDLARIVGLSLGMTNAIVKRLAQKGLLKIRKVNNRNVRYIVSPAGIEAIAKKSYSYFKRTIKNVVLYKEAIDKLIGQVKQDSYPGLVLLGKSDLDFLVEHFCLKHHIDFYTNRDVGRDDELFYLYGEEYGSVNLSAEESGKKNTACLYDIFIKS